MFPYGSGIPGNVLKSSINAVAASSTTPELHGEAALTGVSRGYRVLAATQEAFKEGLW